MAMRQTLLNDSPGLAERVGLARRNAVEKRWSGSVRWTPMAHQAENTAHRAVLEELQRSALETYGEERSAEASLQMALELAATAVWRVAQESLEPLGPEPLPTHG
jgi:hypothetical protein